MSSSTNKIPHVVVFDNKSAIEKMKMDIFNLIEAKLIDNDILSVVVSYSGGCEKHEFTLATVRNRANTDSSHQTNLVLGHDNNGNNCKKIVKERLEFDLSPLKKKYQHVYGMRSGWVILHLMNTTLNVKYIFQ